MKIPQRMPMTPEQQQLVDDIPFANLEVTTRLAVDLAHREIVKLRALPQLNEYEVRSLETLARVIQSAKDMELKEHKIRGSCSRCHGQR